MNIYWTTHARERFFKRALKHGLYEEDAECHIKKQKIRIDLGYLEKYGTNKYKTIFKLGTQFFTVIKAEDEYIIHVVTLWESSLAEVKLWQKNQ